MPSEHTGPHLCKRRTRWTEVSQLPGHLLPPAAGAGHRGAEFRAFPLSRLVPESVSWTPSWGHRCIWVTRVLPPGPQSPEPHTPFLLAGSPQGSVLLLTLRPEPRSPAPPTTSSLRHPMRTLAGGTHIPLRDPGTSHTAQSSPLISPSPSCITSLLPPSRLLGSPPNKLPAPKFLSQTLLAGNTEPRHTARQNIPLWASFCSQFSSCKTLHRLSLH